MIDTESKSLQVDDESKQLGPLDVLQKLVAHSNVDVRSLDETGQVSQRYLPHMRTAFVTSVLD